MLIVAVRNPTAEGLNVTWNVVVPPPDATVADGNSVTVKSAALAPPIDTRGVPVKFSTLVPLF
jgi:hypothetical protein